MLQDLRFAVRLLSRQCGYAAVAILTFALGVGANAAMFSVADSVLFRPLPFANADRLFALRLADPSSGAVYGTLAAQTVDAARATGVFDAFATVSPRLSRVYVQTADGLDALLFAPVSRNYLDLLGVRPVAGRGFDESDAGTRALVLSHDAWVKRYGGSPDIVGKSIPGIMRVTERAPVAPPPIRVVGVLPQGVRLPLAGTSDGLVLDEEKPAPGDRVFPPLVRVSPGVTAAKAASRLQAIVTPGERSVVRLVSVREELAWRQDAVLWLLLAAAAIVLVVACVNLANLTLARGTARTRELAIRSALGSARWPLVRLLLAEGLCIAVAGTAVGLAGGYWATRTLSAALPPLLASVVDPAFDGRAFVFTLAIASAAAAVFSVVPALRLTRGRGLALRESLHMAGATKGGAQTLVAIEVAMCVALVAGAALVGRTLFNLVTQDLGFAAHRLAITYDLPTMVVVRDGATRTDVEAQAAFFRARLRDAREVPGVRAAALASAAPFSGIAPDAPLMDGRGEQAGGVYGVSSSYFAALGIPLLAGRDLTDDEAFGAAPVGVLNLTAAHRLCGTPAACIGTIVAAPRQPARTVVGIVADARQSVQRAPLAAMYVPFLSRFSLKTIVVSSDGTSATADRIRRALSVFPNARMTLRDLDDQAAREISPYRFNALVIGGFAGLTLLLAVVGVYGVMAAIVGQRTREYGVRVALGASRARVNRHVLGLAARPIGLGIVAGILLAVWAARFTGSLLYGVVPFDPMSFAAAALVLLVSGVAAALVPAIRASRVDPIVVLRAE